MKWTTFKCRGAAETTNRWYGPNPTVTTDQCKALVLKFHPGAEARHLRDDLVEITCAGQTLATAASARLAWNRAAAVIHPLTVVPIQEDAL